MTSSVCDLAGLGGGKRTTFSRDNSHHAFTSLSMGSSPLHLTSKASTLASPGAASGGATHEPMCTATSHRVAGSCSLSVSRGGQMWRVAGLHSGALISTMCEGNGVEGSLPHREAGSRPSRHMLPPGHARVGGKRPVGLWPGLSKASRLPSSLPELLLTCPRR